MKREMVNLSNALKKKTVTLALYSISIYLYYAYMYIYISVIHVYDECASQVPNMLYSAQQSRGGKITK